MNDWTRGRARIGVVPFSNTNLEPDLVMLCPPGVSLHFARAGGYDLDAIPDERRMRHYCDYAGLSILYRTDLHDRLDRRSIHPRPAGGKVAPDS